MPRPSNPAQRRAHGAVRRAVLAGTLAQRPPACEVCGKAGELQGKLGSTVRAAAATQNWSIAYHHHSYLPEHQLDVVAVCHGCHHRIHRGRLPEPLTGQRRTDGRVRTVKAVARRVESITPEELAGLRDLLAIADNMRSKP
jgi:hypothetical protein